MQPDPLEPAQDIKSVVGRLPKPLLTDTSGFGKWLRMQTHRADPVGTLAKVAIGDPTWPGGENRAKLRDYFMGIGAREFVLKTLGQAWDEFEKSERRQRTRAKNKAARAARRQTRNTKHKRR